MPPKLKEEQTTDIWLFEIERRAFDPFTRSGGPIIAQRGQQLEAEGAPEPRAARRSPARRKQQVTRETILDDAAVALSEVGPPPLEVLPREPRTILEAMLWAVDRSFAAGRSGAGRRSARRG